MKEKEIIEKIKKYLSEGYQRKDIIKKINITETKYKTLNRKYKFNKKTDKEKLYTNKKWLSEKYKEFNSAQEIAKICGVSPKVITYWRNKLNIPRADMSQNAKKYNANYNYFKEIDTEEKAYWLGFIMADGCVSKTGNSYRLYFGLSAKDKSHLEKFKKAISSTHRIFVNKRVTNMTNNKEVEIATITIHSKVLGLDLINHGIMPNKTGKEKIPIFSNDFKRHFLRGFFDGDGCISYYNNKKQASFEISCASLVFMLELQEVLNDICKCNFNIEENNSGKYSIPFYRIKIMNKKYNNKIYKYLYDDSKTFLDRKKDIAKKYFSIT